MSRKGKDEDSEESPFTGIQTTSVLREARIFNERQLNSAKCARVLTKILYILGQGEKFTKEETTEIFFSATKLFQSQDPHLRRLVYVVIKELEIPADEALIVVSCLSKDMTSKQEAFRANAIRVLAKIVDASMVAQLERFLKQAIVDQSSFIVSSTLLAGQHLCNTVPDVVKRWSNEIQVSLNSKSPMVQYQALALLHKIKKQDRLAISKSLSALVRNPPKGAMAQCLMIRIVGTLVDPSKPDSEFFKFLMDCLHNKTYMVQYEAARTICRLDLTAQQVASSITALAELLGSPITTQRFAAVRTLSEVVQKYPLSVTQCSVDLEHLITDPNRSIATLAITTLLKTGVESNVDRLMKSISGFMADITDEFKMVLVDAIKTLCLKFKHKHHTMMSFLANSLREEGGFPYKQAIVNAMLEVIHHIPEAKENGLEQFCEFIEDCEFVELTVKILHVIGDLGPKTTRPAIFIRFIFNRIILETACVRAAAVTALAKFGTTVPALTDNVIVLLKRCIHDMNDEVRDRAVLYLNILTKHRHAAQTLLFSDTEPDLKDLEHSLQLYLEGPRTEWFDMKTHLVHVEVKEREKKIDVIEDKHFEAKVDSFDHLTQIPGVKELGAKWKSSEPVEITESETEYVVNCVKHIYPNHVLFQFNVTNNMEAQALENVTVVMELDEEAWTERFSRPIPILRQGMTESAYVCLQRAEATYASASLPCTLKFVTKDVDAVTGEVSDGGTEDEYQLEEIEVAESDYMLKGEEMALVEFRRQWDALEGKEVVKKYSLGLETLQGATDAVIELLGMRACEGSGTVPEGAPKHTANLSGIFFGGIPVFVRAGFLPDPKPAVTLQIAVRSSSPAVNKLLAHGIR